MPQNLWKEFVTRLSNNNFFTMQESFTTRIIVIFSFIFFVPVFSLAQTTTPSVQNPVLFRVEVGSLLCKSGSGTASVLFITEPQKGGYFEIVGGKIDENGMTLDRRVSLKSGTYTWKGVSSEGYQATPPSLGEFTIPVCSTSSPSVSSPPITFKKEASQSITTAKETEENIKNKENIISAVENAPVPSPDTKESSASETNQSGTFKIIIFGLIIFGLGIAVWGFNSPAKR
jgi:hypothetical protein